MQTEHTPAREGATAAACAAGRHGETASAEGRYTVRCIRDGVVLWEEGFDNLVLTAGKNYLLDNALAGSSYTAAFYFGFVDGASAPNIVAGDTAASHAGWTENTSYTASTRPAASFNAASGGSKGSTSTSFTLSADATIAGVLMATNSTKGGTSGVIISAGQFAGGSRALKSGDSLAVTYSLAI